MALSRFSIDGRVALVTGGSRGIGHAIALIFAEAGADVVITSRTLSELEKAAEKIRAKGRRCLAVVCDIGKKEDLENLVERVKVEFGRIDILVNNAGILPYGGPLIDAEEKIWDANMDINLKAPFLLSQLVARIMREQGGGSIINISSVGGLRPGPLNIYGVAKAGLLMLTQYMSKEWGQHNIRANTIIPGLIRTQMTEDWWKEPGRPEQMLKKRALVGRVGMPEDVAGTALLLASDASSYITGESILVDGGSFAGPPLFPS